LSDEYGDKIPIQIPRGQRKNNLIREMRIYQTLLTYHEEFDASMKISRQGSY